MFSVATEESYWVGESIHLVARILDQTKYETWDANL